MKFQILLLILCALNSTNVFAFEKTRIICDDSITPGRRDYGAKLCQAITQNNVSEVQKLIKNVKPNEPIFVPNYHPDNGVYNETRFVSFAVDSFNIYDEDPSRRSSRFAIIKTLLDAGANPHDVCLLCWSNEENDLVSLFRLLLEYKYDVNHQRPDHRNSLLIEALGGFYDYYSYPDLIKLMLEAGANINIRSTIGETVLGVAANACGQKAKARKVVEMLITAGAKLDDNKIPPLYEAATRGCEENIEALLLAGADVKAAQYNNELAPVQLLSTFVSWSLLVDRDDHRDNAGTLKGIDLLIRANVPADDINPKYGPLLSAASFDFPIVTEHLLQIGANPNQTNKDGITALMYASCPGEGEVFSNDVYPNVDPLVKFGANVNLLDFQGDTALHYAATCTSTSTVDRLIKYGASVNVQNKIGETPLFNVIKQCPQYEGRVINTIKVLLSHGADTQIRNIWKKTAKEDALSYRCSSEVIRLLQN